MYKSLLLLLLGILCLFVITQCNCATSCGCAGPPDPTYVEITDVEFESGSIDSTYHRGEGRAFSSFYLRVIPTENFTAMEKLQPTPCFSLFPAAYACEPLSGYINSIEGFRASTLDSVYVFIPGEADSTLILPGGSLSTFLAFDLMEYPNDVLPEPEVLNGPDDFALRIFFDNVFKAKTVLNLELTMQLSNGKEVSKRLLNQKIENYNQLIN